MIANVILSKTSNVGNITIPNIKLYNKGQGGIIPPSRDKQIHK